MGDRTGADTGQGPLVRAGLAVLVGLAVGAFTAYGQGWLGDATSSFVNSAGPWSLAAFAVARIQRGRIGWSVVSATLALAFSEVGYVLATEVRGGASASSTVIFWLTAAVLAGPPLGVAAAWSTRRGLLGSLGFAVVGGVLLGEGVYGWTTVADTTDWRYWATEAAIGTAIVVVVALHARHLLHVLAVGATTLATALAVFGAGRMF